MKEDVQYFNDELFDPRDSHAALQRPANEGISFTILPLFFALVGAVILLAEHRPENAIDALPALPIAQVAPARATDLGALQLKLVSGFRAIPFFRHSQVKLVNQEVQVTFPQRQIFTPGKAELSSLAKRHLSEVLSLLVRCLDNAGYALEIEYVPGPQPKKVAESQVALLTKSFQEFDFQNFRFSSVVQNSSHAQDHRVTIHITKFP